MHSVGNWAGLWDEQKVAGSGLRMVADLADLSAGWKATLWADSSAGSLALCSAATWGLQSAGERAEKKVAALD